MRRNNLNLAQKPFANHRPVVRVTALLWLLGGLLFIANFFLYWSFYGSQGETRTTLAEIRQATDREDARIRELRQAIADHDLESQNRQTVFLNDRIRERTFGWSALFDTLADILPRDARLQRLTPEIEERRTGRSRQRSTAADADDNRIVLLEIQGAARNQEAFYEMLEALIGSPAFRQVNPRSEAAQDGGEVRFVLSTQYLPDRSYEQLGESLEETLEGGELLPATDDDSGGDSLDEGAGGTGDPGGRVLRPDGGRPEPIERPSSVSEDEADLYALEEET